MATEGKNWHYGCMKNSVADELTADDCQKVVSLMGLKPAVASRIKNGFDLLSEMEQRAFVSKDNVKVLRKFLEQAELLKAAEEVDKYQEYLNSSGQPDPPRNPGDETQGNTGKPDYSLPHMKEEITECTLSSVGAKLGSKWRQFCIQKLKLTKAEIDICIFTHKDNLPEIAFDCLHMWREKQGTGVTNGDLAKLLCEFGYSREVWGILEVPSE